MPYLVQILAERLATAMCYLVIDRCHARVDAALCGLTGSVEAHQPHVAGELHGPDDEPLPGRTKRAPAGAGRPHLEHTECSGQPGSLATTTSSSNNPGNPG
ncbi:MAG: hypothetical protein MJE77_40540 [Proteobacteria bacterium]|nr:hypothetical protein [Pseudomonadota bacterium]